MHNKQNWIVTNDLIWSEWSSKPKTEFESKAKAGGRERRGRERARNEKKFCSKRTERTTTRNHFTSGVIITFVLIQHKNGTMVKTIRAVHLYKQQKSFCGYFSLWKSFSSCGRAKKRFYRKIVPPLALIPSGIHKHGLHTHSAQIHNNKWLDKRLEIMWRKVRCHDASLMCKNNFFFGGEEISLFPDIYSFTLCDGYILLFLPFLHSLSFIQYHFDISQLKV